MHYQKINLKTKVYKVNPQDLVIESKTINHIQLVPTFNGRTEELKLEHSVLIIGVMGEFIEFKIYKSGQIIDEHSKWILDKELAWQELIIEKTRERVI